MQNICFLTYIFKTYSVPKYVRNIPEFFPYSMLKNIRKKHMRTYQNIETLNHISNTRLEHMKFNKEKLSTHCTYIYTLVVVSVFSKTSAVVLAQDNSLASLELKNVFYLF